MAHTPGKSASDIENVIPILASDAPHSVLRFHRPADVRTYRLHGMPLGNGRIGAMVGGGTDLDVILLNHDRLRPPEYHESEAPVADRLPRLRALLLAGKWDEAQEFFDQMKTDCGCPPERPLNFYHPAGDLILKSAFQGEPQNYLRTLDLTSGVGRVRFDVEDVHFERTYFVSSPDGAFATRLTASQPGGVNVDVSLGRLPYRDCRLEGRAGAEGLKLSGRYPCGLEFMIEIGLRVEGGSVTPKRASYSGPGEATQQFRSAAEFAASLVTCQVRGAHAVTLSTTIQVTGDGLPERPQAGSCGKPGIVDFGEALARHVADHGGHMGRMTLHLGTGSSGAADAGEMDRPVSLHPDRPAPDPGHPASDPDRPARDPDHAAPADDADTMFLEELIEQVRLNRPASPRLCELLFDMGRYVLLATSRPGCEPANLQGIWGESFSPLWHCRYQLDLNLQMNNWLANLVGLHECNIPFFDLIDSMVPAAERFAHDLYGCRGPLFSVGVDGLNVRYHSNLEFSGVAGWLAQNYWDHYQFTLDRQFLARRAYPFMKRVAAFYEDFLVRGEDGRYLITPSASPEYNPVGRPRVSINSTIDVAIARELLTNTLAAAELLDVDEPLRARWREMIDHLPDWPTGSDGALREWGDPSIVQSEDHHMLSHLYPLYPGTAFTCEETPELVDAAIEAVEKREAEFCPVGWTFAIMTAYYARAGRAEEAYRRLTTLLKGFISPETMLSTLSDLGGHGLGRTWHGPLIQVEAVLGATAAMVEMLVQSHGGLIRILPALPQAWPAGRVRGIGARGGFTVDVEWDSHRIRQVQITSRASTTCRVRLCRPAAGDLRVREGEKEIPVNPLEGGIFEFQAQAGGTYALLRP